MQLLKKVLNIFFLVNRLKTKFPCTDHCTNPGYLLSPVTVQRSMCGEHASVKVSIEIEGFQLPVTFTCDGKFCFDREENVSNVSISFLFINQICFHSVSF